MPYKSAFWAFYFERHYTKSPFVDAGQISSSTSTLGCVDFEIFLIFNLGLIIFDGDGYSNGHRSQKNYF